MSFFRKALTSGAALFALAPAVSVAQNQQPQEENRSGILTILTAAIAVENKIDVTVSASDGGSVTPLTQKVEKGDTATITLNPVSGFYVESAEGCAGSLDNSSSTPTFTTAPVTESCNILVNFAAKDNYVRIDTNSVNGGSIQPSLIAIAQGSSAEFTIQPQTGFSIASVGGCSGTLDGNTYRIENAQTDCTVNADFVLNDYEVTASASDGGSISPASAYVLHGNQATFTLTADSGYGIDNAEGCNGTLQGNEYTTGYITEACHVSATFSEPKYSISATASEGGTISPEQVEVTQSQQVDFTLIASDGYQFASVSGCEGELVESTNNEATYRVQGVNEDCEIDAEFAALPERFAFNINGAIALQAFDGAYTTASQSASLKRSDVQMPASNDVQQTSNLVAVYENGETALAIESIDPVNVAFSQMSPDERFVYVALSADYNHDTNYQTVIARNNCALFKIDVETSDAQCVAEGLLVADEGNYNSLADVNQKPLLFDQTFDEQGQWVGSLYLLGDTFVNEQECTDERESCYIQRSYDQRIYKVSQAGELTGITTDLQDVNNFQLLGSNDLLIYGYDQGRGESRLQLYRAEGETYTVHEGSIRALMADDVTTTLYSADNQLHVVAPREDFGFERTLIRNGGGYSAKLTLADDGTLYSISNNAVRQLLPYVSESLLSIDNNWSTASRTPLQLIDRKAFYVDEMEVPYAGTTDVIKTTNLDSGETQILLDEDFANVRMILYNWRLSERQLFFSGLNQATNNTVFGYIDLQAVADGLGMEDYLTYNVVSSASGAVTEVRDIEVIDNPAPQVEPDTPPVAQVSVDQARGESISVQFSQAMNASSVMQNLGLQMLPEQSDGETTDISVMPVWFKQPVHLIPDADGFANSNRQYLESGQDYLLQVNPASEDRWGNVLDLNSAQSDLDADGQYEFFTTSSEEHYLWVGSQPLINEGGTAQPEISGPYYGIRGSSYHGDAPEYKLPGSYDAVTGMVTDFTSSFWIHPYDAPISITWGDDSDRLVMLKIQQSYVELLYQSDSGLVSVISDSFEQDVRYRWTQFELTKTGSTIEVRMLAVDGEWQTLQFALQSGEMGSPHDVASELSITGDLGVYVQGYDLTLAQVELGVWDESEQSFTSVYQMPADVDPQIRYYRAEDNSANRESLKYHDINFRFYKDDDGYYGDNESVRLLAGMSYSRTLAIPEGYYLSRFSGCGLIEDGRFILDEVTQDCTVYIYYEQPFTPTIHEVAAGDQHISLNFGEEGYGDADSYLLYVSENDMVDGNGDIVTDGATVIETTVTTPVVTELTNGTTYYFAVKAVFNELESGLSNQVNAVPDVLITHGGLNDTGMTQCSTLSSGYTDCPANGYPNQDAEFGRDTEESEKVGYGEAGFDVLKLSDEGYVLPESATEWACVRDNVTGLTWQHQRGTGTYSWYNTDPGLNGGSAGVANLGECELDSCDTQHYVEHVNEQGLCGYNDWRMPTRAEILQLGALEDNARGSLFVSDYRRTVWTAETEGTRADYAWRARVSESVRIDSSYNKKDFAYGVILVRGESPLVIPTSAQQGEQAND